MGIWFLVTFLVPLAVRASTSYMRPQISGTECVGFLKQDARGNLVGDWLLVIFPLSAFCRRFLVQMSIGLNVNHTFLTHYNPQTGTFLHDLGLASKLHSTAWVWNPQGISKLVNKVDCWVPHTLLKAIVRAFLTMKSFAAGSSTYPCHMACQKPFSLKGSLTLIRM